MKLTIHSCLKSIKNIGVVPVLVLGLVFMISTEAAASYTVTPSTWNIIGLDSNTPAFGPNRFPVGAKVCSSTVAINVSVAFTWDSGGTTNDDTYIKLRTGSLNPVTIPSIAAGGCADAYFEVEVTPVAAAFDQTRRYHITAGGVSTPTPRELYVEHLVSQSRNGIDGVKLNSVSIPAGGSMNLMVGNTYTIELDGHTAPGGYNQFEEFINFPNTIFQIQSVQTTYTADATWLSINNDKLYADACGWENNLNLPTYLSCVVSDNKAGGTVITTYTVKILSGGGTSETLNTLLYDFSGSSFHYNADYSTGARIANIIDPANAGISKSFSPSTTNVGGVSALTFTLTNPNAGAISGYNFTDPLPANMKVANPTGATYTGCGTPIFSPAANDTSISFSNGTIAGNGSCVIKVNVTTSAEATYTNTTNHLYVDALDTGKTATASLTVNNSSFSSGSGLCGLTLASWDFPSGFTLTSPAATVHNVTASALPGSGVSNPTISYTATNSGTSLSWGSNGSISSAATLTTANNDYFQFAVDATNYSTIYLNFSAYGKNTNSPQGVAVYYGSSSLPATETGTSIFNNATILPNAATWYPIGPLTIPGGSTVYVRIYAFNSKNLSSGSDFFLDDIVFTGCGTAVKPTIAKAFSPGTVAVNGISTLTLTLTNTNSVQLTGAKFTDTLPAGLEVAATPSAATTCTGTPTWAPTAGATTLNFGQTTGGNIPASGSCTVSVNVKATTAGPHNNVSGFLTTAEGGTNTNSVASASLTAVLPPVISELFAPNPILAGGISTLTFTITNPNQNDQLSGVAFTDTLPTSPGNMVVATPATSGAISITFAASGKTITRSSGSFLTDGFAVGNTISTDSTNNPGPFTISGVSALAITVNETVVNEGAVTKTVYKYSTSGCGTPTFAPGAGAGSISFTNGTIAGGGTCTVTVNVTAPTTGSYVNTSGNVSNIINSATVNGNTASDTLTVAAPHPAISLFKEVASTNTASTVWSHYIAVPVSGNVYYSFQVQNDGDVPLSSVSVTDNQLTMSSCSWKDGDGNSLTAPFTLEVANNVNNKDFATCTIGPITAVTGSHQNVATTYGTYNSTQYSDTDSATYATTGLTLVKKATQTYFTSTGNTLNYSYTVTNNSAAPLLGPLTVADDKATVTCPAVTTVGNGDNYLDSYSTTGEKITCTAAYTVTASDVTAKSVTNTATATINSVTSNQASITVPLAADLSVIKANDVGGSVALNGTFKWTLTVSNAAAAGSSASFANGQTLLTDELPTAGATYAVGAVTSAGGTTGTINCAIATNTLACVASGAVTIPSGGSFSVPVTVTATASGSLVNPKSGGVCKVDKDNVVPEISETNNDCASNTVTVTSAVPNLTILKSVQPYSDPVNGTSSPKAIPGSFMTYTIHAENSGAGAVDNNTTVITDPIPANTELFVGDINGAGSGPVIFTTGVPCNAGTAASGLSYNFVSLSNTGDNISFSKSNGTTYDAVSDIPAADANQCDTAVTHLKVSLSGPFNGTVVSGGSNTSFCLQFRVRVK